MDDENKEFLKDLLDNGTADLGRWDQFYEYVNDELFNKYIQDLLPKLQINAEQYIKQLINDKKYEYALLLSGFSSREIISKSKTVPNLMLLYNNGVKNEYINELVNNYLELKKVNEHINSESLNIKLLEDNIFKNYSTQFISDVLEYNSNYDSIVNSAVDNFINNSNSYIMKNLEKYLKENNLYSRKILHYILFSYNKFNNLLDDLITKNIKLTEIEKKYFLSYIYRVRNQHEKNLNYNIGLEVNNLTELRNYKDNLIKASYNLLDVVSTGDIKILLYTSLFGLKDVDSIYGINISKNTYLQQKMEESGLLDENDKMIINIFKLIESINDVDKLKQSFRDVIKKNIKLDLKYLCFVNKVKCYFEEKLNDECKITKENIARASTTYELYKSKKIEIKNLTENFTILYHRISNANDGGSREFFKDFPLFENPILWNNEDKTSTISCSLGSDKYISLAGGGVVLGFYDLPNNSLIKMHRSDGGLTHGLNVIDPDMNGCLLSADRLIKKTSSSSIWNEVGIYRKNNSIKEHGGRIQPSCVLYDPSIRPISEEILEFASYFNIPIVRINSNMYKEVNEQKTKLYKSGIYKGGNIDINDVKEILSLNQIEEKESIELICSYINGMKFDSKQEFDSFVDSAKEKIIDYYLSDDDGKNVEEALILFENNIKNFYRSSKLSA